MQISPVQPTLQLLPADGQVHYFSGVFDQHKSSQFMQVLSEKIDWKQDVVKMYGKTITTKRRVAWYGEKDIVYRYSGIDRRALPWTSELFQIKELAQEIVNKSFNSCLLNFYSKGSEGMAWHSDDEKELDPQTGILSISLGAERRFCFRHKTKDYKTELMLENGSVLWMDSLCQKFWKHSLPVMKKVQEPRINLTFRNILQ
jgi:alkylated DNA repair dioxygenase AlkB